MQNNFLSTPINPLVTLLVLLHLPPKAILGKSSNHKRSLPQMNTDNDLEGIELKLEENRERRVLLVVQLFF